MAIAAFDLAACVSTMVALTISLAFFRAIFDVVSGLTAVAAYGFGLRKDSEFGVSDRRGGKTAGSTTHEGVGNESVPFIASAGTNSVFIEVVKYDVKLNFVEMIKVS